VKVERERERERENRREATKGSEKVGLCTCGVDFYDRSSSREYQFP